MHEYALVAELVDAVLERMTDFEGSVCIVHLRKGELRILSNRALKNAYEVVAQGTALEGSRLEVETVPTRVICRSCGFRGPAQTLQDEAFHFAVPILTCPQCGSDVEVTSGRELVVDRLTLHCDDGERADGG